jgi:cell division septal protein FtsQ
MTIKKYGKIFFFSTTLMLAGLQMGKWVNRDTGFRVEKVMVTGCKTLAEPEVIAAAQVPMFRSIFDVEFSPIAERVEALPYVQKAQVTRVFPSTIVIAVKERKPLALVNHAGLWPVDEESVVLPRLQSQRRLNDPVSYDTPILSGVAFSKTGNVKKLAVTNKRVVEFLATLRATNAMLYHSISEVHLNAKGHLTFYLMDGGVPVYLGDDNWMEKCERLFIFLQHVRPASGKFLTIDLRYENQIVTRES